MILYLDTSALLKLYLDESNSRGFRRRVAAARVVCTHLITFAEMRAGLAQAARMERLTETDHRYQTARFEADWLALQVIGVDEPLIRRAGELAERFALRGYDSVHLAAAERAHDAAGRPRSFAFAAFDGRLRAGADALALSLLA